MAKVDKVQPKEKLDNLEKLEKPEKSENDIYPKIRNFRKKKFNLKEFLALTADVQFDTIKKLLDDIYDGTLKIDKSHVLKCIAVTVDDGDTIAYLPCDLKIERTKNELIFSLDRDSKLPFFIIFFLGSFLFLSIAAAYTAINYINLSKLNVDLNGDGIADLNIDINGDKKPELNVDLNGDKKPDINITYKGNRKNVFNIDTDNTYSASANLINLDINDDGKCDINCDLNEDGWPDINIDVDGDKVADFDIDIDGDNIPDLNLDMDGDLVCDLMCDTDGDKKCDKYCIKPDFIINSSGLVSESGNASSQTSTPDIQIMYNDGDMLIADGIYPTDQANVEIIKPTKTFSIYNPNNIAIDYYIKWIVYPTENAFTSDNFKYKIESTNGGATTVTENFDGYLTVPKETTDIISTPVTIQPLTTQKYSITMMLKGTGKPQNEDQGRTFAAKIFIFTNPDYMEPK